MGLCSRQTGRVWLEEGVDVFIMLVVFGSSCRDDERRADGVDGLERRSYVDCITRGFSLRGDSSWKRPIVSEPLRCSTRSLSLGIE